jgi:RNA polymerase sigma-70 factor, ECF subfamily
VACAEPRASSFLLGERVSLGVNEFRSNIHEERENAATAAPHVLFADNDVLARDSTRAQPEGIEVESDRALVVRLNSGDLSAFEVMVARHKTRIYSMAYQMLRDREDAEEVTQDTFVNALRGLGGFRGDAALSTWITQIARNLARNRYWYWFRRKRHETVSFDTPLDDGSRAILGEVVAPNDETPYDQFAADDLLNRVREGMSHLTFMHHEVLTLKTVHNLSYNEIAIRLGIPIGTVKSRILRARENLRLLASIGAESGSR